MGGAFGVGPVIRQETSVIRRGDALTSPITNRARRAGRAAEPPPRAAEETDRLMLFSSPLFLFLFLPLVLAMFFLARGTGRNMVLLVASLGFYAWGEGRYVLVMAAIIAVNYAAARRLEWLPSPARKRFLLAATIAVDLIGLIAFKYANFLVDNVDSMLGVFGSYQIHLGPVHLPLGISFFTFHAISYLVDIHRGQARAGGPLTFALYMTFFPHSIAGPIVRYGDIAGQLVDPAITTEAFARGVRRFVIGLAKKMLIANPVATVAEAVFQAPTSDLTASVAWLGVVSYTLQIYFDFSGYSDMAIGLAAMFGIDFRENFDRPYIARSVTEFWRRWHISLSTWFRDYVYIPLGGNRRGPLRTYANLLIVFALCGMWHGASWNFLVWGLFHGVLLVAERMGLGRWLERQSPVVGHVQTMLAVMIGWVFFRAESVGEAFGILRSMAGFGTGTGVEYHPSVYLDPLVMLAMTAGVIGSMPVAAWMVRARERMVETAWVSLRPVLRGTLDMIELGSLGLMFLASSMFLAAGTHNPFIYFRF